MKKRILSTLMALVMCLTLLPTEAFAATETTLTTDTSKLNGGTYSLPGDGSDGLRQLANTIEVTADSTLDLNGQILSAMDCTDTDGYKKTILTVKSGATLTLTDSKPETTHLISYLTTGGGLVGKRVDNTKYITYATDPAILVESGGTLIMEGGTITGFGGGNVGGVSVEQGGTFVMNGGTIKDCAGSIVGGVYVAGGASFTMNGGTVENCGNCKVSNDFDDPNSGKCATNVYVGSDAEFTISGDAVIGTGTSITSINDVNMIGSMDAKGGTISGSVRRPGNITSSASTATKFTGSVTISGNISAGTFTGAVTINGEISGGTFSGTVTTKGGKITGGRFSGTVNNSAKVDVTGGDFTGATLTNVYAVVFKSTDGTVYFTLWRYGVPLSESEVEPPTKVGEKVDHWIRVYPDYSEKRFYFEEYSVINEDMTLIPYWKDIEYTVQLTDGGDGYTIPTEKLTDKGFDENGKKSYKYNDTVKLPALDSWNGRTFAGWTDGTNTFLANKELYHLTSVDGETVTLWPKWTGYTVELTFDLAGGTYMGSTNLVTSPATVGSTMVYPEVTREGYQLNGWEPQVTEVPDIATKFTAKWTPNTYTVHFDANGGTGTMADQTFKYDTYYDLRQNAFTRDGCNFLGWALEPDSTTAIYTDGQSVGKLTTENEGTVTLYAIWCNHPSVDADGKCDYCGGEFVVEAVSGSGDNTSTVYYTDLVTALEKAPNGATLKLLKDYNAWPLAGSSYSIHMENRTLTIDLNGKTVTNTANRTQKYLQLRGGNWTFTGSGTWNVQMSTTSDSSLMLKGSAKYTDTVQVCGSLTVQDTVQVQTLSLENNAWSADISGGSFGAFALSNNSTKHLGDALADGYGFKTSDGTWYDQYNNSDATKITNVTVTAVPITKVELTADKTTCTYGEPVTLTAKVTALETTTGGFTYQYYRDDHDNWAGETVESTTTTCEVHNFTVGEHPVYVEVTNNGYTARSKPITVTVNKVALGSGTYPAVKANSLTYSGTTQELISFELPTGITSYEDWKARYSGAKMMFSVNGGEWSETIPTATDAGTYTVNCYIDGGTNYDDVGSETTPAGSVDVIIGKKNVTITPYANQSKTYGADDPTLTYYTDLTTDSDAEKAFKTATTGALSRETGENVGSYAINLGTLSAGGNFMLSLDTETVMFAITKAAAPTLTGEKIYEVVYSDTAAHFINVPDFTSLVGWPVDIINPHIDTFGYDPENRYTLSAEYVENGDQIKFTLNSGLTKDKVDTEYTIYVNVESDNYQTFRAYATIKLIDKTTRNDLSVSITGWTYGEYDATANKPVIGTPDGTTTTEIKYVMIFENGSTGSPSENVPAEAGNWQVLVECETDTEIWYGMADFVIAPKNINKATITLNRTSFTYNGTSQKPTVTVMDGTETLIERTGTELEKPDYTVSGQTSGKNADTYTITITGEGNYTGEVTKTWSIVKAPLTVSVTAENKIYDGTTDATITDVTFSGLQNGETLTRDTDYTVNARFTANANVCKDKDVSATITLMDTDTAKNYILSSNEATTKANIGKKAVTVTALDKSAYINNAAPDLSAPVADKDYTVTGLVEGDTITVSLTCNADMSKTGEYDIVPTATAEKDDCYAFTFVNGKLKVTTRHSSGSSTNSTVKNPDGSNTTTVTDKNTGTVTETNKTATGTTSTTVTDKDGNSTTTVSVSQKDAQSGEIITLPVDEVKAADKSENAQEITVNVPSGGATVEIPVENPTPGTVIVIVDKNGNETVVPTTKQTENGVSITLTEDATIKVIENGKKFSDVKDSDYFGNAVDWASSRGITGGISATTFGPHESCTRAQFVTFLWRAAGSPEPKAVSSFNDVSADAYYAKAVAWAVENGITGGIGNNQFAPDLTCTRAQAAAFLFRYAAASGMEAVTLQELVGGYGDASQVPGYALPAFNWALAQGILQGYNGNLMPNNDCTRAQIVTMLYRLLGK